MSIITRIATMILKDNTNYYFTADNIEEYLPLQKISNKKVSDLLDENGNDLLIYPHSFSLCKDEAGKQYLFSLHPAHIQKFHLTVSPLKKLWNKPVNQACNCSLSTAAFPSTANTLPFSGISRETLCSPLFSFPS